MKRKSLSLSRRYAIALRTHLHQGPHAGLQAARDVGRQAVVLGLETLDMAKIHEEALTALKAASSRNGFTKRAESFFTEVVAPIEKTHNAARRTDSRLDHLSQRLKRRTVDLAATRRSLQRRIAQRKTVEKAIETSGGHSRRLLEESHRMQRQLRNLTHQILLAQEDKRKSISRELQDEIAQTLLAINVRLLTLKQEADMNAEGVQKEIASTRTLVDNSIKSIKRFAREFGKHH